MRIRVLRVQLQLLLQQPALPPADYNTLHVSTLLFSAHTVQDTQCTADCALGMKELGRLSA
jgi:hypothetical protein